MGAVIDFDVKKPFGTSVRTWRGRRGISQEELAGRAGLHRTYICDVERGRRNVSLESIEKLARALEISLPTLFSYEPCPGQPAPLIPGNELVEILFVEDNANDIELTMDALKNIPNRVALLRDGLAAVNYLFGLGEYADRPLAARPHLVLLDLRLPKMDGLEVLRRIKSNSRTASIPVVVLTASEQDRDIQASKRLGAAAYIVKPVNLRSLAGVASQTRMQWALFKEPQSIRAISSGSATSSPTASTPRNTITLETAAAKTCPATAQIAASAPAAKTADTRRRP